MSGDPPARAPGPDPAASHLSVEVDLCGGPGARQRAWQALLALLDVLDRLDEAGLEPQITTPTITEVY